MIDRATLLRWLRPGLVASALAAIVAGLVEAVPGTTSVLDALAATGFVTLVLFPLGLVVSLALRALVAAWRPAALAGRMTDPGGGAPRLAAALVAVALAIAALGAGVLHGMRLVIARTSAEVVHMLAAPLIAVGVAFALAALSGPAYRVLAAGFGRLERGVAARRGRPLLVPRRIVAALALVVAVAAALAWRLVLAPEVGDLELDLLGVLGVWLVVLVATPPLLARALARRDRARVVVAIALAAAAAPLGVALWTREARPGAMLSLWGETPLAGQAIDLVFDIQALRRTMRLEDVAPPARPGAPHPDVVLVTIDTVRGDLTPPLGGVAEMPNLARFAGEAAVFEWAFSPGNVTRRSLPSMATGRSPPRVLGRVAGWALKLDPRHVLLAERFAAAGYDTAGFFCCDSHFGARHRLGLERGFDHVEIAYGAGELATRLQAFLAARRSSRPLFVWLHFIEPHNWERDQPETAEARTIRQRYLRSLAAVDRPLGVVLDAVWAPARRDRTVVVVTADHGESLGDHRSRTHAKTLFNTEVRVPFVLAAPGVVPRRIRRPVGLVDLAPTLLDLAGFVPPGMPEMDGVTLAPVLAGQRDGLDDGAAYVVQMTDRSVKNGLRAVVVGRYKLIVDGDDEPVGLYDYVSDRGETRDLAATKPDVVARLLAELGRRRAIDRVAPPRR